MGRPMSVVEMLTARHAPASVRIGASMTAREAVIITFEVLLAGGARQLRAAGFLPGSAGNATLLFDQSLEPR